MAKKEERFEVIFRDGSGLKDEGVRQIPVLLTKKKMFIEVEREMARYDIIAGKIADDATNATLTAYLAGAFGTAGDKEADDFCIRQLLPNKLKDQYCFKTEAAIKCLKFVKGEKIWLK